MTDTRRRFRRGATAAAAILAPGLGAILFACLLPVWAGSGLLRPPRRAPPPAPDLPHEDLLLDANGIQLSGWRFPAAGARRGLVVYLHGFGDDRREAVGLARRYGPLGFDVLAYDSRAHGRSGGTVCTYGVLEKEDLARALDRELEGPVALIGGSLGAAVALEAAADDARISLVVAIAPFSDLRCLAADRAPCFVTRGELEDALRFAEREGGFRVDDASPLAAAPRIRCPVLLLHGASDTLTPPGHSERIFERLSGPRRLVLEPGHDHHDPLDASTWDAIDEAVLAMPVRSGADPPH